MTNNKISLLSAIFTTCLFVVTLLVSSRLADAAEPKRLLVIGQGPDGHPPATHEFMAGARVIEALLKDSPGIQVSSVECVEPWAAGPELILEADGVVIFVGEGARWAQADSRRLQALNQLAERGGGIVALHGGIGTKDPKYIEGFRRLIGGIHGGPDRKHKVLTTCVTPSEDHPIARGIEAFESRDEFYYSLKFLEKGQNIQPVLQAKIENKNHVVAWAWQRPDDGRSFGFSGLHFHENWKKEPYQKLVAQAIYWTLKQDIPDAGLKVDVDDSVIELE